MSNPNEVISLKDIEEILNSCRLAAPYKTPLDRLKEHKGLEPLKAFVDAPKHDVNVSACPYCKAFLNAASNTLNESKSPEAGDLSVCLSCAEILIFDKDLKLAEPSFEIYQKIFNDPALSSSLKDAQDSIKKIKNLTEKK